MFEMVELKWYCVRAQQKREHLAARTLWQRAQIETFCPRVSQVKVTKAGKRRFVEAMFPNYFFARFQFSVDWRTVTHVAGVHYIVQNGRKDPFIPDEIIGSLREGLQEDLIEVPEPALEPGALVEVLDGSLKGMTGKVLAMLPGSRRVAILLEFLGRDVQIELDTEVVVKKKTTD